MANKAIIWLEVPRWHAGGDRPCRLCTVACSAAQSSATGVRSITVCRGGQSRVCPGACLAVEQCTDWNGGQPGGPFQSTRLRGNHPAPAHTTAAPRLAHTQPAAVTPTLPNCSSFGVPLLIQCALMGSLCTCGRCGTYGSARPRPVRIPGPRWPSHMRPCRAQFDNGTLPLASVVVCI